MYPEDRVLVAYVASPADFTLIRQEGWYRIPQKHAPKGVYAEYFAFYFGRKFGSQKWAIHYYAARLGHELLKRRELFPDQPDHPRAGEPYFKVQLGPLQHLDRPIVSLRWRRITFLHTTGDRFQDATEINDLFVTGGDYVDRIYVALKERGIQTERNYRVQERGNAYDVPLTILCRHGRVDIDLSQRWRTDQEMAAFVDAIERQIAAKGGIG